MVAAAIDNPRVQQAQEVLESFKDGDVQGGLDQLRIMYNQNSNIPGTHGPNLQKLAEVAIEGGTTFLDKVSRGLRGVTEQLKSDIGQKLESLHTSTQSLLTATAQGIISPDDSIPIISAHIGAIKNVFESNGSFDIKVEAAKALGKVVDAIEEKSLDFSKADLNIRDSFDIQLSAAANSIGDFVIDKKTLSDEQVRSFGVEESKLLELALKRK